MSLQLYLSETVNRGADASHDDGVEKLSGSEVLSMIRFGAEAVFAGGNREPTDAELDRLLDRTRTADDADGGALRGGAQLDAASFDATSAPVQTKTLFGRDLSLPKSERDIAEQWRLEVQGKREKKSRVKMVESDGSGYGAKLVPVLTTNDYELGRGQSVFERELGGRVDQQAFKVEKRKLLVAGRDYEHEKTCLTCFVAPCDDAARSTGPKQPALLGCRLCPMAFHPRCARAACVEGGGGSCFGGATSLTCPHHACMACGRKASAAGGMLFRCEACPSCFCEDCLPHEAEIVGGCTRLEARGIRMPPQGCYIRCSSRCIAFMQRSQPEDEAAPAYAPLDLDEISTPSPEEEAAADPTFASKKSRKSTKAGGGASCTPSARRDDSASEPVEEAGCSFDRLFGNVIAARHEASASALAAFDGGI